MGVPGSANFLLAGAQGYKIERSLRFNSADSAYLVNSSTRTAAAGAYTFSFWIKRCTLGNAGIVWSSEDGSGTSIKYVLAGFGSDNIFYWWHYSGLDADTAQSNGALRDPSAWYHIVLSKPASAAGTLYINGVAQTKQTSFTADSDAFANAKYIGRRFDGALYSNCYLTEFYGIDGQALTPSSFGETNPVTGVWQSKRYTGTYGTNGFYLKFADNSGTTSTTLGKDSSGNGNNWTPNNFSVTAGVGNDSMIDTPTPYADGGNGRGNYCIINPVSTLTTVALANGNLDYSATTAGKTAIATIGMSSAKWYWEVSTTAGTAETQVGVYGASASTLYSLAANSTVCGIRFDAGTGALDRTSDGTNWTSIATGLTSPPYFPYFNNNGTTSKVVSINFGQRPFAYTPPSGFLALNTQNLPEPTIKKPGSYMDVKLYTGNGGTQTISGLEFSPDLVWVKGRSTGYWNHILTDSARGNGASLMSNTTGTDGTRGATLTSAGFTFTYPNEGGDGNNSGTSFVAWCWDKNATPGFDIVTYTGNGSARTIAHSLGVAPSMIIAKCRSTANDWAVYHSANTAAPETDYLLLNSTAATADDDTYWSDAAPTSSVFSIGPNADVNANTSTYVAYLWSEVAGFSKFGSYTGNGSTDGPFVYCGFRPRWVMIKRTDGLGDWALSDAARPGYNVTNNALFSNLSDSEFSGSYHIDFVSTGFKLRGTTVNQNQATSTYIFAAFAESPFKYSLAR